MTGLLVTIGKFLGGKVVDHAVERSIESAIALRWRIMGCSLFRRHGDLRVSFSAFLRIASGDSYLLVRNLHRADVFGPLGGVYKYYPSATRDLSKTEFRPQGVGPEMENDLRGFIPRHRVSAFLTWFHQTDDRETSDACIHRELREELGEVDLPRLAPTTLPRLRRVRTCEEGPERVAGQAYTQYRRHEILEFAPGSEALELEATLMRVTDSNPNVLLVSADEIRSGRARNGYGIGHHACYLLGEKRLRPDEPALVPPSDSFFGKRHLTDGEKRRLTGGRS